MQWSAPRLETLISEGGSETLNSLAKEMLLRPRRQSVAIVEVATPVRISAVWSAENSIVAIPPY
jgi:hypothetical protein